MPSKARAKHEIALEKAILWIRLLIKLQKGFKKCILCGSSAIHLRSDKRIAQGVSSQSRILLVLSHFYA